jgi:hypothetical protein
MLVFLLDLPLARLLDYVWEILWVGQSDDGWVPESELLLELALDVGLVLSLVVGLDDGLVPW